MVIMLLTFTYSEKESLNFFKIIENAGIASESYKNSEYNCYIVLFIESGGVSVIPLHNNDSKVPQRVQSAV